MMGEEQERSEATPNEPANGSKSHPMTDTHKLVEALAKAAWAEFTRTMASESVPPWSDLTDEQREKVATLGRALLTAIEASGYRVVPVGMTPEMRTRVVQAAPYIAAWPESTPEVFWKQMLEIAPKVTP